MCITSYPFTADKNDELSFVEGRVIRVVRKVEGGWWEGQLDQRVGWFPANHVEEYPVGETDGGDEQFGPFANTVEELNQLRLRTIWLNNEMQGMGAIPPVVSAIQEEPMPRASFERDLVTAEKGYSENLQKFVDEFVSPLEHEEWLPRKDHERLFGSLHDVTEVHRDLAEALEAAPETIGKTFLDFSERFGDAYTDYCVSLPRALTIAAKYSHHAMMSKFLQTTAASHSTPPILHVVSFLHKPVQWMHRYVHVLNALLNHTDEGHPDRGATEAACEEFTAIVEQIESEKKSMERREVVRNLSSRLEGWEGPSLNRYGDLIMEGNLKLHEGVRKKERTFYLLEKILVVVRSTHSKSTGEPRYKVIEKLLLTKDVVSSVIDGNEGDCRCPLPLVHVFDCWHGMISESVKLTLASSDPPSTTLFAPAAESLTFAISFLADDLRTKTLTVTAFNLGQKRRWMEAILQQLEGNECAGQGGAAFLAPEGLPGSDEEDEGVESGTHTAKRQRKKMNWLKSFGERIMKRHPSFATLREDGEGLAGFLRRRRSDGGQTRSDGGSLQHQNDALPVEPRLSGRSSVSTLGKRPSVISIRSGNRSPPPPEVEDGDEADVGPPPMPPLPEIVKESLARRACSMEVGRDLALPVGVVRAKSDTAMAMMVANAGLEVPAFGFSADVSADGRATPTTTHRSTASTPESYLYTRPGRWAPASPGGVSRPIGIVLADSDSGTETECERDSQRGLSFPLEPPTSVRSDNAATQPARPASPTPTATLPRHNRRKPSEQLGDTSSVSQSPTTPSTPDVRSARHKSSASNLVQAVRGMFKRTKSYDALHLASNSRNRSFTDLTQAFGVGSSKNRGGDAGKSPASEVAESKSYALSAPASPLGGREERLSVIREGPERLPYPKPLPVPPAEQGPKLETSRLHQSQQHHRISVMDSGVYVAEDDVASRRAGSGDSGASHGDDNGEVLLQPQRRRKHPNLT
ncbi:hypothetical protein HK104_001280, partial [Borealophlyctis nickersoniae]